MAWPLWTVGAGSLTRWCCVRWGGCLVRGLGCGWPVLWWSSTGIPVRRSGWVRVTRLGHVRLPAAIRRGCALVAGDRVLLAADATLGRLVVYPPAALDAALAESQAGLQDGDPR